MSTFRNPLPHRSFRRVGAVVAAGAVATTLLAAAPTSAADRDFPEPTAHSQKAYDPEADFTAKWTRADARQIMAQQDASASRGENSVPLSQTMPEIPKDFPTMTDEVWVWDTWSLTDESANQLSYKGWDVIFSLVAPRDIPFDDRHWNARIGYFFRPTNADPTTTPWQYGGYLFPDDASISTTEWSGSTRLIRGNTVQTFYTATTGPKGKRPGTEGKPAVIASSFGKIHADRNGVSFDGFSKHTKLLEPDGAMYQTPEQNQSFAFRDPFTFEDPAHPGKTFMVFEGNSAGVRGSEATKCDASDLGYRKGEENAETVDEVNSSGAFYQRANIGLAVAENKDLTRWKLLPPLLSANCVNDQTERPQIYIQRENGRLKYYLFTISHQFTYAAGTRGPDGVYGFVGDGIRSDYKPLNDSGLVLGSPTDLNLPPDRPESPTQGQNPRQFQAYSHYVQPNGLVQSFIDNVDGRRGGTLAPTVKINFFGGKSTVDREFGDNGLGPYGWLPTNKHVGGNGFTKAPAVPRAEKRG